MRVLGVHGGPHPASENPSGLPPGRGHDASAVLVEDGELIAAVEESRLDRIKHSNKTPLGAMRFCLAQAGLRLEQVDRVAFVGRESFLDAAFVRARLADPRLEVPSTVRAHHRRQLSLAFGAAPPDERLLYVPHHLAHAMSAVVPSGFEECLVVTMDEMGDDVAGTISHARGAELQTLDQLGAQRSLGRYYLSVIEYLGYGLFDEYKVMGLAPYGDPARFRPLLEKSYQLLGDGRFALHWGALAELGQVPGLLRRAGERFEQIHCDVAAALQQALEAVAEHWIHAFAEKTGLTRLALAGGVALNCHLAGRLRASSRFRQVFVQPASSDAGCALGAALEVCARQQALSRARPMRHVFYGPHVGEEPALRARLARWAGLVSVEEQAEVHQAAARLLAAGSVIGWVQGRSELGPRALGHRSILADPRPASNKDRVNAMIKLREAYRPFAPAVLAERAAEIFELGELGPELGFMCFIVPVRPEHRAGLGATTHVDGSARVQVVQAGDNPELHRLLSAFHAETGVPVLLNTSFNNHAEPIVDSLDDAVSCFLSTGLDALFVGRQLVRRLQPGRPALELLCPSLPAHAYLVLRPGEQGYAAELRDNHDPRRRTPISPAAHALLARADGTQTISELLPDHAQLLPELYQLWSGRRIRLLPKEPHHAV